jgi:hypothetical protein
MSAIEGIAVKIRCGYFDRNPPQADVDTVGFHGKGTAKPGRLSAPFRVVSQRRLSRSLSQLPT